MRDREELSRFRFIRSSDLPVETGRDTVYASLWHARGRALVYLGNYSGKPARGSCRFDPSRIGGKKFTVTKLNGPGRKDFATTCSAAALKRKGIGYSLKPWGSGLYRVEV